MHCKLTSTRRRLLPQCGFLPSLEAKCTPNDIPKATDSRHDNVADVRWYVNLTVAAKCHREASEITRIAVH